MGEGHPNVFLFIYVCILFLLANLLFDTKDCIIYFSLPRKVDCVAINPLILHTASQRRKVWQQGSSSHTRCVQSGVCGRSSVCSNKFSPFCIL